MYIYLSNENGDLDMYDPSVPRAYLNYILFDEDFIPVDFGFSQVTDAGATAHELLSLHVKVERKGYLYVYLSNEQTVRTNVYFDDFRIVKHTGVVQVDDYYPFGLTFNSYSRENATSQNYLYNGKELQDEMSLGWLDYGARMYDGTIARWMVIDPLAALMADEGPYNYAFNNPVVFVDIFGLVPGDPNKDPYDNPGKSEGTFSPFDYNPQDPNERKRRQQEYVDRGGRRDLATCRCSNNGNSKPNDDWQLNEDGSFTLIKETSDPFHRYFTPDRKLIFQTNWNSEDVGRNLESWGGDVPGLEWLDAFMQLGRSFGIDENARNVQMMYDRAGDLGWDYWGISNISSLYNDIKGIDAANIAKSLIDYRPGRYRPQGSVIGAIFQYITGRPLWPVLKNYYNKALQNNHSENVYFNAKVGSPDW